MKALLLLAAPVAFIAWEATGGPWLGLALVCYVLIAHASPPNSTPRYGDVI